ncbi:MAG TPA: WD40 repeat domain-containing protein [Solirubrobacteraceae bacterium]|jgi:WD40 repeat protein|nr:WD40 repeat domain-containing protein [Solirubrobacteraceae bacterium]
MTVERLAWLDVDPYVRRHIAAHAAHGSVIDPLLRDVGYLASVDPKHLLPYLDSAVESDSRAIGSVYRRITDLLAGAGFVERMALLHLRALQEAPDQASLLEPLLAPGWDAHWVDWRGSPPSTVLAPLKQPGVVAITRDARTNAPIAVVASGREVRCWDLLALAPHPAAVELDSPVSSLAASPDGVLIGTVRGELRRCAVPDLEVLARRDDAHASAVTDIVAFEASGEGILATCCADGPVALWRREDLAELACAPGAHERTYSLTVLENGDAPVLVSAGDTVRASERMMPAVRAWRVPELDPIAAPELSGGIAERVFALPSPARGDVLILAPVKQLLLWNISSPEVRSIPLPKSLSSTLEILATPDEGSETRLLIVATHGLCELSGSAGALRAGPAIETPEMAKSKKYSGGRQVAGPVALSAGAALVSVGDDLRLWSLEDVRKAFALAPGDADRDWELMRAHYFTTLARVGNRVWSGNEQGELHARDSDNGRISVRAPSTDEPIVALCSSRVGEKAVVIAATRLGRVRLVDGESGEQLHEDLQVGDELSDMAVTETTSGAVLATASWDPNGPKRGWGVRLWRLPGGEEMVSRLPGLIEMTLNGWRDKPIGAVTFAELAGRKVVLAGGSAPFVSVWDFETFRHSFDLYGVSDSGSPLTSMTVIELDHEPVLFSANDSGRLSLTQLVERSSAHERHHVGRTAVAAGRWGGAAALFSGGAEGSLRVTPLDNAVPTTIPIDAAILAIEPVEGGVTVATTRGLVAIRSPERTFVESRLSARS